MADGPPCPPPDRQEFLPLRDGAPLRLGYWGDGPPSVLILTGRCEFIEKYGEVAARLRALGHSVACLDWRGQGLSGGRLAQRQVGHVEDFDVLSDDLAQVVQALAAPRIALLAHSMGGAILLRSLQRGILPTASINAAVAIAPMLTLPDRGFPRWLARSVSQMACACGFARHYALGQGDWGEDDCRFADNGRTGDPDRFAREVAFLQATPALALGGPSWGWVRAAYHLSQHLRTPFTNPIPLTLIQGALDGYVPLPWLQRFQAQTANSRLIVLPQARHEPLMESDETQAQLWPILADSLPKKEACR